MKRLLLAALGLAAYRWWTSTPERAPAEPAPRPEPARAPND
jgi:hypothetical protein